MWDSGSTFSKLIASHHMLRLSVHGMCVLSRPPFAVPAEPRAASAEIAVTYRNFSLKIISVEFNSQDVWEVKWYFGSRAHVGFSTFYTSKFWLHTSFIWNNVSLLWKANNWKKHLIANLRTSSSDFYVNEGKHHRNTM